MNFKTEVDSPGTRARAISPLRFYAGLFLITACTLMLQVVQTRILSVVAWYHLAFFAISMAMFGLTAGAVWLYLRRDRFTDRTLSYDLSYYSVAYALAIGLCFLAQMTLAPIMVRSMSSIWTWAELAVCMAVPFFFSGVVVSLALTRSPFAIGRVYGVDLLGAATGCLGVLVVLNFTDAPSAILWIAAFAAAAAWLFSGSGIGDAPSQPPPFATVFRHRGAITAILGSCALLNGLTDYGFQPLVAKGHFEGGNSHIFRQWNSFSRIAVYREVTGAPQMWGPSARFAGRAGRIQQRKLNIDGDAGTYAYRFTGDLRDVDFLRYDITSLAYHLPGRKRVAVIGVGGGRDILTAALFGSNDITGVEINPIFVRLLTREPGFADFTDLRSLAGVKVVIDEGRSWFARTDQAFDVVQMSLIDTWAATGAGAFSLSENGLYTVEAWKTFLSHLTTQGVYTVSRWYNPTDATETGRMLSLAVAALIEMGVSSPEKHVFLATQERIATLVVARQPFSVADLTALREATDFYQYRVLVSPSQRPDSDTLGAIVSARERPELERITSAQQFDLTPATDDRPFFFNQVPINKPIQAMYLAKALVGVGGVGGVREGNLVATATLLILFFISLALVLGTIVIPMRSATQDVGSKLVYAGTLYFLLIGIGFMAVEIGLLQRMSVFLGHPIYSLSVSLFTLILATGIGSLLSDELVLNRRWKFVAWAVITSAYVISLPQWLPPLLLRFDSANLFTRAAVCIAVIAPAGLLMGFAFPTGMRFVSAIDRRPTPWFWGINGAAGVLASVMAVGISIALGISTTLTIGSICYLLLIPTLLLFFDHPNSWPKRKEAAA
jgi:hypothetical protein